MKELTVLLRAEAGFEPTYSHPGDAGADLRSRDDSLLLPGSRAIVGTGVSIALPDGFVGLVHPRSGLAANFGITVLNAPGTIDAGYRGEVLVTLLNTSTEPFQVSVGDRIGQLVIQEVFRAKFIQVAELPESHRGPGGLGSTGRN